MEPRIDLFTTEIGAKFAKRFANVGPLIVVESAADTAGSSGIGTPSESSRND
jgi:hypothetical protein